MLTDYKIVYMSERTGSWEVLARFYEGDITTEDEQDSEDNFVPVTRYRRTRRLRDEFFRWPPMLETALHGRLRADLARDQSRTPIPEQRNA